MPVELLIDILAGCGLAATTTGIDHGPGHWAINKMVPLLKRFRAERLAKCNTCMAWWGGLIFIAIPWTWVGVPFAAAFIARITMVTEKSK